MFKRHRFGNCNKYVPELNQTLHTPRPYWSKKSADLQVMQLNGSRVSYKAVK